MFRIVRKYFFATAARPPFMSVTESAVKRMRTIMGEKKDHSLIGVKISLTKKGCNGLSYTMNYVGEREVGKLDEVVEVDGMKVIVDSKAVMALVGTKMNFVEDELGSQFTFENPNEKGRCGCGQSFHF